MADFRCSTMALRSADMCYFYMTPTPTGCKDWDHNHPASLRDVGTPTNKRLLPLPCQKWGPSRIPSPWLQLGVLLPCCIPTYPNNINLPAEGQNAILHIDLWCHHIHQHRSCEKLPIDVVGIWYGSKERIQWTHLVKPTESWTCDTL